jgi:hypothetical protein
MTAFAEEFKHALTTRFNKHYVINDETGCWEWTPDEPLSQLAKEFGVSETHIWRIRLGKSRLA